MTCIVGLRDKGDVYIGGDSAGVAGLSITTRQDEKVFANGPFIFGFTQSFRMGQILRYRFDPPKQHVNQDDMRYMVTDFIDALRNAFASGGYGKTHANDDHSGGTFLVGYNEALYTIHSDFQVGIPILPYDAVGCGADIALGSMHATGLMKNKKPEERITMALEAAATFSAGVAAPFTIIKLPKAK